MRIFVSLLVPCFLTSLTLGQAEKPGGQVQVEFRRAETTPAPGLTEATVPGTKDKVYLHKAADATNKDIAEARPAEDGQAKPAVEIIFTREGAKKMAKLSQQHQGKPLAILVNGKVISAPVVKAQFSARALITGNFTKDEADKLVKGINGK
jgi:preprotein translocase subunit SecD